MYRRRYGAGSKWSHDGCQEPCTYLPETYVFFHNHNTHEPPLLSFSYYRFCFPSKRPIQLPMFSKPCRCVGRTWIALTRHGLCFLFFSPPAGPTVPIYPIIGSQVSIPICHFSIWFGDDRDKVFVVYHKLNGIEDSKVE